MASEDEITIGKMILGVIIICIVVIYGIGFITCNTFKGQRYDVVITVQAVEKSTRFGDHTNVWARVYGDQDITYTLIGHHDLKLGETYRVVFINRMRFHPLNNFYVWGEVEIIELLS